MHYPSCHALRVRGRYADQGILNIYKDTVLAEEQIKADNDFFARRYNIDVWKSSQHPGGATRELLKRVVQENYIHNLFRTHKWDIVNGWKVPYFQVTITNKFQILIICDE